MEFVEGRPLSGPLSLDESLKFAAQICEALEAAHQAGVIHRDLKPSNILATKLGIKLLDFGIARMASGNGTLTAPGTLMGTPAYLAPEIWKGKPADARSDIYSLGCVLHELVTGSRALERTLEPPALERIVRACLAENPDDRWQSARDVRLALDLISPPAAASLLNSRRWPWAAAAAIVAMSAGVGGYLTRPPAPVKNYRFEIQPPGETRFIVSAISPDAKMLVFRTGPSAQGLLFLRRLDGLENRPLPGTEGAAQLVWSPDSRQVAFAAGGKFKRIDLNTGNIQTICDSDSTAGATWNEQGVLLFLRDRAIHRVPVSGGISVPVTSLAGHEASHGSPWFLPDGRHFLFTVATKQTTAMAVYVSSLDAPEKRKRLAEAEPGRVVYVSSARAVWGRSEGYILSMSGGTLVAQPFDPERLEVRGDPFPIAENVSAFSASATGAIATRSATSEALHRLVWRDRRGTELSALNEPARVERISLTKDGNRLAYLIRDEGGATDIWLRDMRSGSVASRLPTKGEDFSPVWSPDGNHLAFALGGVRGRHSLYRLVRQSPEPENMGVDGRPSDWSRDGRFLLLSVMSPTSFLDLHVFQPEGRKLVPFLSSPLPEWQGQFSPEQSGPPRWIAYTMSESGAPEVYVQRFSPGRPAAGQRWKISTQGGVQSRWRADGRELFYRDGGKVMAAPVRTEQDAFHVGRAVMLFDTLPGPDYAVAQDGMRFLLIEPVPNQKPPSPPPVVITLNWQENMR